MLQYTFLLYLYKYGYILLLLRILLELNQSGNEMEGKYGTFSHCAIQLMIWFLKRKSFFSLCLPIKRSPMVYAYQGRINSTAGKCSTTQTTLQIGCHYSPPLSNMRLLCLTASSAVALMSLFLSGKQLSSPQYILAFLRSRIAYS